MASFFKINGQDFGSGLLWQPLSGTTLSERKKEIKLLASEMQSDLSIAQDSNLHTIGFAKTKDGIKDGFVSAALVVSIGLQKDAEVQNFIFVDQLPDGQWIYVCQREGYITPDGDQLFKDEDSARAQVLQELSVGNWQKIITPDMWGMHNSNIIRFEELIPKRKNGKFDFKSNFKIGSINASAQVTKHFWKIIFGLSAIFAIVFGVVEYKKEQERKALEEAQRLAEEAAAQANQVKKLEHPWKLEPLASDVLTACVNSMKKVVLFPGNWDIQSISCDQKTFTIAWKARAGGWIAHLRSISPAIVISPDGNTASISIPFDDLKTGFDEVVGEQNKRLLDMLSAAQMYGVKLTAKPVASNANTLPGQAVEVQSKDWEEINWKAEDVYLPEVVLKALEGNGFRMSSLSANWVNGQFIWTMEGKQYAH